jgi:hypothetical protein
MAHQFLEWYYLIFELPLALGLLYLGMYTFSGWTFGDADADASGIDHDVDAHLDVHGEVTLDHDADLSHDIEMDADADADADADTDSDTPQEQSHTPGPSPVLTVLSWIGVGKMPISLVLMVLLICWGTIGFACMQLQLRVEVALAIAAVGSVIVSRAISSVLSKTVFAQLNVARRRHELLGCFGEALYDINQSFGMACGRDDRGELFQVPCRIEDGQPPLTKGSAVQLVAYTAREQVFTVVAAETSRTPRKMAGLN